MAGAGLTAGPDGTAAAGASALGNKSQTTRVPVWEIDKWVDMRLGQGFTLDVCATSLVVAGRNGKVGNE